MTRNKITAVGMMALLLLSAVAMPVNAASGLDYSSDGKAPNPYASVDSLTVESWNNSDFDEPTEYYDDSGDPADLRGDVNRSSDAEDLGTGTVNPITVTATDIEVDEFGEFPRKSVEDGDNSASALDASEWSTDMSGSAGSGSVSDVSTAPNVDAVGVSTSGQASGDTAVFTYGNFSITSDAEKRYVQLAADVNTLDSGATAEVRLKDSDGDYVTVGINGSADASANDVLANSTGEGQVAQVQIGQLQVEGSGDGSMSEIQSIDVVVSDGDVAADFALINAEKTSEYTFGEKYVDSDDDDELETETITDPRGPFSVHSVDTFGSTFSSAVYHSLSYPAHVEAKYLPSEDVKSSFDKDNAYPNWASVADIYYRLSLPSAYDLTYSGVELVQEQRWAETRYATVEIKEDAGDTDFDEIDNWTDKTSSFNSQDSTHTLDSTVSIGTEYAIHIQLKLTSDEASAMQSTAGGAAGPMGGSDDGGLIDTLVGLPGIAIAAVGALIGRAQGWF